MNTQLVCTFANRSNLELVLDYILKTYTIPEGRIFLFENALNFDEIYCTYNISKNDLVDKGKNTILIHRKKDYNTLYTVNAINIIIRNMNNGVLDTTLPINWHLYSNSLLLTSGGDLRQIKLQFTGIKYV